MSFQANASVCLLTWMCRFDDAEEETVPRRYISVRALLGYELLALEGNEHYFLGKAATARAVGDAT